VERLYALTHERDPYITTEVGQRQMWARSFQIRKAAPLDDLGRLGTMGYGCPQQ